MLRLLLASTILVVFSGCASITTSNFHDIKVETKTEAGEMIVGADCALSNDYGILNVKSGDTAKVRRSSKDLEITCKQPSNPDAIARLISRANAGMYGNILIGGGIGAIIDHSNGTAYTYPTWVQLIFGRTMIFDRSLEKSGQPAGTTYPLAEK